MPMRCDAMDTVQVQSSHTLYVNLVWGQGSDERREEARLSYSAQLRQR